MTNRISFPRLITNNASAVCLQYIQGDASHYHPSLSNYTARQPKASRSRDRWHLGEEQAAPLPPAPGPPRCPRVPPTSEPGSCEFGHAFQDAACRPAPPCAPLTSHQCCGFGTHQGRRLLLPSLPPGSARCTACKR